MTSATGSGVKAFPAAIIKPQDAGLGYFWRRFRRNRLAVVALIYLILIHLIALTSSTLAPHPPNTMNLFKQFAAPSSEHPLGTDESGRDVLSRLIFGARASLAVAFAAMLVALTLGVALGAISGFYGNWVDVIVMRLTDGMLTIPTFFLALLILAVFGSGIVNVVLAIGLTGWMVVARIVRAEVLRTLPQEYVLASRAIGSGPARILTRHILPQALPSVIVAATLGVAFAVLAESALSYLGLGVQPPTATWGNMLTGAQQYVWTRPRLAVVPGALILMTVLSYNAIGDAFRDTLDPRHRGM